MTEYGIEQEGQARAAPEGPNLQAILSGTSDRVEAILEAAERAADEILAEAESQAERYLDEVKERGDRLMHDRVRRMAELSDRFLAEANRIDEQSHAFVAVLDEAIQSLGLDRDAPPTIERHRDERAVGEARSYEPDRAETRPIESEQFEGPATTPVDDEEDDAEPVEDEYAEDARGPSRLIAALRRRSHGAGEGALDSSVDREHVAPEETEQSVEAAIEADAENPEDDAAASEGSEGARLLAMQMALSGSSREEITQRLRDEFGVEDLDELVGRTADEPSSG